MNVNRLIPLTITVNLKLDFYELDREKLFSPCK